MAHAAGILEDAEYLNRSSRFFGLVISAQMLREHWSSLERGLVSHPGIAGRRARIVTLLTKNVTMPPGLRLRDWIDFRDGIRYDQGVRELATLVCGDQGFAQGTGTAQRRISTPPRPPLQDGEPGRCSRERGLFASGSLRIFSRL